MYSDSSLNSWSSLLATFTTSTCCNIFYSVTEKKTLQGLPVTNEPFLQVLELHAGILQQILSTVLNIIIFDGCRNQWSMSRPLLGLILLNEQVSWVVARFEIYTQIAGVFSILIIIIFSLQYFNQLRENIIRSQPADKQAAMAQWFENLMDGVERNLLSRNRDR